MARRGRGAGVVAFRVCMCVRARAGAKVIDEWIEGEAGGGSL